MKLEVSDRWVNLARHVIDRGILLGVLWLTASDFDATEIRTWVAMVVFGGGADRALSMIRKS